VKRISFIDSHTGGEPTRTVIAGAPDLGDGPLEARLERLLREHDHVRRGVVLEPRGSDVMVAAFVVPPLDPASAAAVLFVNNVGGLGMCGHGLIGVIASLAHLGRIGPGSHVVETPVGSVRATLHDDGRVTIANVASYRSQRQVALRVALEDGAAARLVHGDVAWGGNWFFLCHDHGLEVAVGNLAGLQRGAARIKRALADAGVVGSDGAEIDHVELMGPGGPGANARSFVLCPGDAYDRSPCGTGTSAVVACLAADGELAPGAEWVQESVIGSRFVATYMARADGGVDPVITGRAWVSAVGELLFEHDDPFAGGIELVGA